ncbi:ABC transporter permease [Mucilaginibacter ginkgonis]|uniref:ABC transporter permease n=1 Tax=Mucilaginibacter ginkgonis TaxID=2682091 RepID=A0A6I4I1F9_9SPHI|nr:ABC transporter permease [Mucilaginibacter ginkgonis]QQL51326.1 ABC transporter permease [Mucilaginibacter ginkgonis]
MIRNYIKTAWRSLMKNRAFTAINVFGLALGLTACLLIVLYVVDELSFDRYNTRSDRIYRVNEDLKLGNNAVKYAVAMAPLAQTLKNDFPDVENAVRIKNANSWHIKKGAEKILEPNVAFADQSLFDVFTLPMLDGNPSTALKEPNSMVITETTAKKYFNTTEAVGRNLTIDDNTLFKVTGVIKDIPKTSHFNFNILVSMSTFPDSRDTHWLRSDYNTYVLLRKGADPARLEAAFPQLLRKYSEGEMEKELHQSINDFERSGSHFSMNLIPLTDIHLHSNISGELGSNSTMQYIYIFSVIGIFILFIACVNFMNLSTARSSNRAREVGVRKVLGSSRNYLIAQFLTESLLITLTAAIIALAAAVALLPLFNQLAGKEVSITINTLAWLIPVSIFLVLVIGFLAGAYPAFFLSAFQPVDVLKGKIATGFKGGFLRSFLVIFQFSISIFLIIGTLVIYNQLHYIQTRNLGYDRKQVLVIKNTFELEKQVQTFKQQVKELQGVSNATVTGFIPTGQNRGTAIFYKDAAAHDQANSIFPQTWPVDYDYLNTLGMKLSAGRNFSQNMGSDSSAVLINETAAKFLGFKDPIGKTLYRRVGKDNLVESFNIIGVIKDFNFNSLRENISPVVMRLGSPRAENDISDVSVKVSTANLPVLLSQIQVIWSSLTPTHFEYSFMDEDFNNQYRSEQRIGQIFIIFTSLAILIACLGLFGLAAYAAEQRTKEIGIRKVLGASVSAIVGTLSKDFLKLIIVAIVLASPLAWYAMHKWLQDFAYRINVQWYTPVIAAIASMIIAFITISFQSVKAALMNPIKSLKNE